MWLSACTRPCIPFTIPRGDVVPYHALIIPNAFGFQPGSRTSISRSVWRAFIVGVSPSDSAARRRAAHEHAAVSPAAPAKERAGTAGGNHRSIRRTVIGNVSSRDGLPGSSVVKEHRTARLKGRTHHERRRSQEAHHRVTEVARRPARARAKRTPHVAAEDDGAVPSLQPPQCLLDHGAVPDGDSRCGLPHMAHARTLCSQG